MPAPLIWPYESKEESAAEAATELRPHPDQHIRDTAGLSRAERAESQLRGFPLAVRLKLNLPDVKKREVGGLGEGLFSGCLLNVGRACV